MADSSQRIIKLQWVVIGVLLIGFGSAFYYASKQAEAVDRAKAAEQGNIESLKRQVIQAKANKTPAPAQLPEAATNGPAGSQPTKTPATPGRSQ